VLRARAEVGDLADRIARFLDDPTVERDRLELYVRHYLEGGTLLLSDGGVVLTWPDGGVARRRAAGHWG
jgi:hypothetical protein